MLTIDGSYGEGGGQILRSALALALITQRPFRITAIRARRLRPGLMRQHLTAVNAAAGVGSAEVCGAALGSKELTFAPRQLRPGAYAFDVGTAGSTTLVLQTVLPALLLATAPSSLVLEGGTHNPNAPPFDFLEKVFLPLINRMGPSVAASLERPGFFPAGGGKCSFAVRPGGGLAALELSERGPVRHKRARVMIARLPRHIAQRELETIRALPGLNDAEAEIEETTSSRGPGNVVTIEIESEHITELFTGFGQRGVRAETVAENVGRAAQGYLDAKVPVGEHLADQLLLPLALAGGGGFRTQRLTRHAETNLHVIDRFLGRRIEAEHLPDGTLLVRGSGGCFRVG
jgi:RNA 3'-terminal phosphate cyclase (ATP)